MLHIHIMELPVVIISLLVILIISRVSDAEKVRRCNIAYRCSSEENIVWATDGKSCQVFRNVCHLKSTNCDRINRKEPELKEITKAKCQRFCNSECPENHSPICGYYNEQKRTFANQCEMDNHICKTGETFGLFSNGECK